MLLLTTYLLTYLLTNYVQDPAREEIYDAVKVEYELDARLEALNQQLDYAEGAMHSIKERFTPTPTLIRTLIPTLTLTLTPTLTLGLTLT